MNDCNAAADRERDLLRVLNSMYSRAQSQSGGGTTPAMHEATRRAQRNYEAAHIQAQLEQARLQSTTNELTQATQDEVNAKNDLRNYLAGPPKRADKRRDRPAQGQKPHPKHPNPRFQGRGHRVGDGTPAPPAAVKKAVSDKSSQRAIDAFHATSHAAFDDYSKMTIFPAPPAPPCTQLACLRSSSSRALQACPCNIRAAFSDIQDLKTARVQWHPDKFSKCPESLRAGFQKKAQEVFVVVDALYKEQQ